MELSISAAQGRLPRYAEFGGIDLYGESQDE